MLKSELMKQLEAIEGDFDVMVVVPVAKPSLWERWKNRKFPFRAPLGTMHPIRNVQYSVITAMLAIKRTIKIEI